MFGFPRLSAVAHHRWMIYGSFATFGILAGLNIVGLSELKLYFDMSETKLGTILTVGSLVALPSQFYAAALIHRYGVNLFVFVSAVRAITAIGTIFTPAEWGLYLMLPLAAFASGLYNIIINAGILHHEHDTNEVVASTAHAIFSVGAIVGSALAGIVLDVVGGFRPLYLTVALTSFAAIFFREVAMGLAHDPEVGARPPTDWSLLRNRPILLLTAVVSIGSIGESIMYVWPAIYLRETLGSTALLGALGSSAFFAAMALGRFAISPVQKTLGRVGVLIGSGLLISVGMTVALVTQSVAFVIAGFIIVGVAYAAVVPLGFSVAGAVAVNKPSAVAALLGTSVGISNLIAPGLIGVLASAFGLRRALVFVVVAGVAVFIGSVVFQRTKAGQALSK